MPQALTFSLTNILKFMSYLSPLLITFFMIMYSILTNNIVKGLIFMSGLVIITFINYLLKNTIKSPQSDLASPFCNTLPAPFTFRSENNIFNSPSTSSTIIAFAALFKNIAESEAFKKDLKFYKEWRKERLWLISN